MWWTEGNEVPALVTTSPDGTQRPDAGVLGRPGTSVPHGGTGVDDNYRLGLRLTVGYFLDDCHCRGIEATWFSLGDGANTGNYFARSVGSPLSPILARPFTDVVAGQPAARLIAFPNVAEGDVRTTTSSEMHSVAVLGRRNWQQGCNGRVDFVGGYRFLSFREGLTIEEHWSSTEPGGPVAIGTRFDVRDAFATENTFHGGEIGLSAVLDRGSWSVDVLTKVALGDVRQQVRIDGSTVITVPNQTPVPGAGGLLALPTNIGSYSQHELAFLPELDVNLRLCLAERLDMTVGYTLLWLSHVARTGDQIDTGVNPTQLVSNGGTLVGPARPAALLGDSSMWVQGLNLGVVWKY